MKRTIIIAVLPFVLSVIMVVNVPGCGDKLGELPQQQRAAVAALKELDVVVNVDILTGASMTLASDVVTDLR